MGCLMKLAAGLLVAFVCSGLLASEPGQRTLTFEERVAAQQAIEQVYWNHRIWPKENPGPKPPLAKVLPEAALRAGVEDALRKSHALATVWGRPITHLELQAEMDRMARETRDAATLRELSAALGDDPFLIAEALARPIVADRLARRWYASDARVHGALRKNAEAAMTAVRSPADLRTAGERYQEITWTTREYDRAARTATSRSGSKASVGDDDLATLRAFARNEFGLSDEVAPLPVGRVGRLHEDETSVYAIAVLDDAADTLTVATASWPKASFDAWWSNNRAAQASVVDVGAAPYAPLQPLVAGSYCTSDTWTSTSAAVPSSRRLSQMVWTGSEMIVWSGVSTFDQSGGRYNPATDSWTPTSQSGAPPARYGVDAVWTGTEMLFWGGGGNYEATGGRYNPATDRWTATTATGAPSGRQVHTSVWTGSELIVWGGYDAVSDLATGGRYNPSTNSWVATATGGATPLARSYHRAVWSPTSGVMLVWGGGSFSGTGDFTTGGRYSPGTNSWAATSTVGAPQARQNFTAVYATTTNEMIVWGGRVIGPTAVNSGGRYNPASDAWTATSVAGAPSPRQRHTAVWDGSEMIAWGGEGNTFTSSNFGGRYNPSTDAWISTTTSGAPTARRYHTAVWTGTEMIVWGGDNAVTTTNTGGRYNPATNSWVPTSTSSTNGSPPLTRIGHTAVWTGSEMIVWGGEDTHGTTFADGSRYNPATATWAVVPDVGALTPRANHTAIWSGTEMVVWGGTDRPALASVLNDGGAFDPATGNWTNINPDVLAGREKHTAVWTGSAMIVWGGRDNTIDYNNGAAYYPASLFWDYIGSPNIAPRAEHTAVWTGTEMIVWGGGDFSGAAYDDGARYDGVNGWIEISGGGSAPEPRARHTAVWTGSRMIVWGGVDFGYLASGGLYTPSTNSWSPTSTILAPLGRADHVAAWNGGEMIVWGGRSSQSTALGNGERYNPGSDSWQSVSNVSAPTPRYSHTEVWTGAGGRMIVWGGSGTNANNGGIYCSCASSLSGVEGAGGLTWAANKQTLSWGPLNTATQFNVYRGTTLSSWVYNHTCLSGSIGTTSFSDAATPASSSFFYYLVSGRNGCGESALGNDSSGTPRPIPSACP